MLLDLLHQLNRERAARRPAIVVTDLESGAQRLVTGDAIVTDGEGPVMAESLRSGRSGVIESEGRRLFLAVHKPPTRVVVIGAVHISQALAVMAQPMDLALTIIDPRTAFADPERFPGVDLRPVWPQEILPDLALDSFTAVVALTHDPRIDDPALAAALGSDCFYVGALGSRKTHTSRRERLGSQGFSSGALDRIHAPIGLDIGAVSPAEIALSVLGEIVLALRGKPTRSEQAAQRAGVR